MTLSGEARAAPNFAADIYVPRKRRLLSQCPLAGQKHACPQGMLGGSMTTIKEKTRVSAARHRSRRRGDYTGASTRARYALTADTARQKYHGFATTPTLRA